MHLAHVFIGRFDLPVPLSAVLLAAAAVVAASFGLIYLLPPRPDRHESPGRIVPRALVVALQTLASLYLVFLVAVSIFGRQTTILNAAVIAFWVITIPGLPLLHCLVGGVYEVANPFALVARLFTGGRSARMKTPKILERIGYWPAVAQLLLLIWFELALRIVPNSPLALGVLTLIYFAFQVAMGMILGEAWYRVGDVWQVITSLASTIAPVAMLRDQDGFVRFRAGFRPARFLPEGRGREAVVTLWLAGVLADGVRVTPIWQVVTSATQGFSDSLGTAGDVNFGDLTIDTAEILFTWAAFGLFFVLFVYVAAYLSRHRPGEIARVVSPSLIPIALAYLLAHNLSQLVIVGPLIWTARNVDVDTAGALIQQNIATVSPSLVFAIQVGAIVLGHVLAVITAHARLTRVESNGSLAMRGDLGWLAAMLIYTATSLWVLAQPITNSG
ncbi:MAG: hypothetical protein M3O87_08030 [Candidatus Dormibacteraeota bacterium]|nr:hypothetical protein [Candidatus Dormibacteraeota bacterium]